MTMTAPTSAPATGKPPRRARRRLITLSVTLAAAAGLAGLAAPAAFAGVDGGVDMNAACVAQYGPGTSASASGPNVYDWACFGGGIGSFRGGINVGEQCVAQYGSGAEAQFSDYNDPYTWYCYTPD
jgi:hypothetical protein